MAEIMKTVDIPVPTSGVPTTSITASSGYASPTTTLAPIGSVVTHNVGDFGTRTLWAVFIIMVLSSIGFSVLAWRVPVKQRLFHQITTYITLIAAISYFAMATNSGWQYEEYTEYHESKHGIPDVETPHQRQVYYARYIDWLFTTPLLLLDLSVLAGLNGANIVNLIFADVVMIITGLFAVYSGDTRTKYGWYAIGWIAFLVIIAQLAINGRANASKRGGNVQKLYVPLAVYTVTLWFAYPIIWAVGEGAHNLTVNQEVLAYAVLDVLAKPVFGAWLLITHSRAPEIAVSLDGVWSDGLGGREGALRVGDDDEA